MDPILPAAANPPKKPVNPFAVAFVAAAFGGAIVGAIAYVVLESNAIETRRIVEGLHAQLGMGGDRGEGSRLHRVEFEGRGVAFSVPAGYRVAESANPEGGEATMTLLKADGTATLKDTRVRVTVSPETFDALLALKDAPPIGEPYALPDGRRAVKTHYRGAELYGETTIAVDHPEAFGVVLVTGPDGDPIAAQVLTTLEFLPMPPIDR